MDYSEMLEEEFEELCRCLPEVVIANNEVYRDILNDKSTIENYFTEEIDNNLK